MTEHGDPASRYIPPPPFAPMPPAQQAPPGYFAAPGYYAAPGWPPPYAYPPPPPPRLTFGTVAAAIAGSGALLVAVALLALPWFSVEGGLTAGDVRTLLDDRGAVANQLSVSYFSWFAWVLVLLSAGCAIAAALPRAGMSLAFRIAGPIVAGFAVLFTLAAMELTDAFYGDDTYYVAHLGVGFWVTLVGFTLIGAGCIVGPRRHRDAVPADPVRPPGGATFQK